MGENSYCRISFFGFGPISGPAAVSDFGNVVLAKPLSKMIIATDHSTFSLVSLKRAKDNSAHNNQLQSLVINLHVYYFIP